MQEHTVKAFDEDITRLRGLIAEMGGLSEAAIAQSLEALIKGDDELADRVVKGDKIRNIPWEAVEMEGTGHYCEDWSGDGWGKLCFTVTREDPTKPVFTNAKGKSNSQNWTKGFVDLNFAD